MIQIDLNKTAPTLLKHEVLTSGMVNAVAVKFTFTEEWEGLTRVAVFDAGDTSVNCVLDAQDTCFIPWECLANPGERLRAGVYGTLDGELVLPSEQCDLGLILAGAAPGQDGSLEGSPSLAEQMIIKANEALAIAQAVRDDADAGEFDGVPGVQGVAGPKGDPGDSSLRLGSISLPAADWLGTASPYSQSLVITGGTAATQVDLHPDASQLAALLESDVSALFIQNDAGTFTAYAIGGKPTGDLVMQVSLSDLMPSAAE